MFFDCGFPFVCGTCKIMAFLADTDLSWKFRPHLGMWKQPSVEFDGKKRGPQLLRLPGNGTNHTSSKTRWYPLLGKRCMISLLRSSCRTRMNTGQFVPAAAGRMYPRNTGWIGALVISFDRIQLNVVWRYVFHSRSSHYRSSVPPHLVPLLPTLLDPLTPWRIRAVAFPSSKSLPQNSGKGSGHKSESWIECCLTF